MSLSHAYGVPPPPDVAADILLRALELGVTHFDTAALYGFGANEELVGRTLGPHRSRFTLASKCGISGVTSETGGQIRTHRREHGSTVGSYARGKNSRCRTLGSFRGYAAPCARRASHRGGAERVLSVRATPK
jgi:aryl-alcohol dehydrogenase-like predicted oxidoreductase